MKGCDNVAESLNEERTASTDFLLGERPPLRLTAYFDESHDATKSKVFVYAGWTAWRIEWESFGRLWHSVLLGEGLQDFHMADYEASRGAFKGWDRRRKVLLLAALIDAFDKCAAPPSRGPVGFWSAVELPDYEKFVRGHALKWEDDPMFLCFLHCIKQIFPMIRGTPAEAQVDFVFDWKPELEQRTRAIFWQLRHLPDLIEFRHRFGELSFSSRRQTPQLQAADLLAYECFKHLLNALDGFPRPKRKSLARLETRIVYSSPMPRELLRRLGIQLDLYYAALAAMGIPKAKIDTL